MGDKKIIPATGIVFKISLLPIRRLLVFLYNFLFLEYQLGVDFYHSIDSIFIKLKFHLLATNTQKMSRTNGNGAPNQYSAQTRRIPTSGKATVLALGWAYLRNAWWRATFVKQNVVLSIKEKLDRLGKQILNTSICAWNFLRPNSIFCFLNCPGLVFG